MRGISRQFFTRFILLPTVVLVITVNVLMQAKAVIAQTPGSSYTGMISEYGVQEKKQSQEDPGRLEIFSIEAPQLRVNTREIFVYLPPDYHSSDKFYPVMYFHDGGMVFSTNGNHDSHFDRALDQLFEEGDVGGIIGVGILTSENRWDELSPWENTNMDMWRVGNSQQVEGGEGDAYLEFVINTVKPLIDDRYRTLPDRENTAIGGFSMGGFMSIYAGLKYPHVFSKVMAMSPAVWFGEVYRTWMAENHLLELIRNSEVSNNVKFYLDIGDNEWADNQPIFEGENNLTYPYIWVDGANAVFNALRARHIPKENILLVIEEGGTHYPFEWGERSHDALLWLFNNEVHFQQPVFLTIIPPEKAIVVNEPPPISSDEEPLQENSGAHIVKVDPVIRYGVFIIIAAVFILTCFFVFSVLKRRQEKNRKLDTN